MITTVSEEIIEPGQVGVDYKYTACTPDSTIEEENLTYQWTVTWQQASDAYENAKSYELQAPTSRVITLKFLQEGTYTLRCVVSDGEEAESLGTFAENLPTHPILYEWFAYTACTPDTLINPVYMEYLWVITRKEGDEYVDASEWIEMPSDNDRTTIIKFNYPGIYKIKAIVFSMLADDILQESYVCEEIIPLEKIGDVEIVRGKNRRFGAVHPDATAPRADMVYKWECEGAEVEWADRRVARITFGNYGTYVVQCTVTNVWAWDSPQVATWEIEHGHSEKPEYVYPNWERNYLGHRVYPDNNEFLGNPVHGQNYNPHSQANRFWKIWLDDGGYAKRLCVVLNETGELVYEVQSYQHQRIPERWVSVELFNIGTGNQFEDDHMDARLYTMEKEEHPYNKMYLPIHRYFYVGVHRRETKRLPFDIAVRLGPEYLKMQDIPQEDRKYIMNLHDISPHW